MNCDLLESIWASFLGSVLFALLSTVIISSFIKRGKIKLENTSFNLDNNSNRRIIHIKNIGESVYISKSNLKGIFKEGNLEKFESGEMREFKNVSQLYLKTKIWRNVPCIGTSVWKVSYHGLELKLTKSYLLSRIFSRCKQKINKRKDSNKIIAKDFKKLLKIRGNCDDFVLRASEPQYKAKFQISLWASFDDLYDVASSLWHYPKEFNSRDLKEFMEEMREDIEGKSMIDFIDYRLNRKEVRTFIKEITKEEYKDVNKNVEKIFKMYETLAKPYKNDFKFAPFRSTKNKNIQIRGDGYGYTQLSNVYIFKKNIPSKRKLKDSYGFLIENKDFLIAVRKFDRKILIKEKEYYGEIVSFVMEKYDFNKFLKLIEKWNDW